MKGLFLPQKPNFRGVGLKKPFSGQGWPGVVDWQNWSFDGFGWMLVRWIPKYGSLVTVGFENITLILINCGKNKFQNADDPQSSYYDSSILRIARSMMSHFLRTRFSPFVYKIATHAICGSATPKRPLCPYLVWFSTSHPSNLCYTKKNGPVPFRVRNSESECNFSQNCL